MQIKNISVQHNVFFENVQKRKVFRASGVHACDFIHEEDEARGVYKFTENPQ